MQTNNRKPKVLILTLNSSYPLTHGGAIGQYYILDGLKDKVDFVYCTIVRDQEELNDIKLLQKKQPNLKIYFVDNTQQKKQSLKQIIKKVIKFPYQIIKLFVLRLLNDTHNDFDLLNDDLRSSGLISINTDIDSKYIDLVEDVLQKENITQVQLDFFATMPFALMLPPKVKKIFICHELRYKRLQLASESSNLSAAYKKYIIERMRFYEETILQKMDCIVVLNEDDKQIAEKIVNNVVFAQNAIPDEMIYRYEASKTFNRFIFAAPQYHTPNALGLSWFLDTIYIPNIQKIPFPVYVIGKWSKEYQKNYSKYKQIVFCGFVDSIQPYLENSILINPILTGAGIRMKVMHAMANKVPVFTTRFGAEGCYSDDEKSHLAFFDSPDEFMKIIESANDTFLETLALAGNIYYNTAFNKEKLLQKRLDVYNSDK
ncbi:glycosyl transferase [Spirochaetia bacterium]|nr:glycosyl transferase [Spirochaetia bacterium]